MYIFLDYHSIPQKNLQLRHCAIDTLGVFASIAQHFIVIAPTSTHKNTKLVCNKASYGRRGWCRLEQWGHLCQFGMADMHYFNVRTLVSLDEKPKNSLEAEADWFMDSIMVYEGDYTNPENKKEMVDVVLGLYAMVLAGKDDKTKTLYELVSANRSRVFPAEFFDDMPTLLATMMESDPQLMQQMQAMETTRTSARRTSANRNSAQLELQLSQLDLATRKVSFYTKHQGASSSSATAERRVRPSQDLSAVLSKLEERGGSLAEAIAKKMREPAYSLGEFDREIRAAFPELRHYFKENVKTTSGESGKT
eukprot:2635860-Prymnesium_polylepis.1